MARGEAEWLVRYFAFALDHGWWMKRKGEGDGRNGG